MLSAIRVTLWIAVIVAAAAIVALYVFVASGNRRMAKDYARSTARDVEVALEEVLDPQARHDAFDLFLTWPLDDPYLESIRKECLRICRECPAPRGRNMSDEGEARIAALLADLRRRQTILIGSS